VRNVEIFDSTLRDGAQGEGISFSVQDKLNIVKALDDFGVDYIEAGNPFSNPKDTAFFEQVRGLRLKNAKLCAFGSTCRKGVGPCDDENVAALLKADTETVTVFGKAWDLHVTEILRVTLDENFDIVESTVRFLKQNNREVIFDAEHFFDGYAVNPDYALEVLKAAKRGGADLLCLCDTNGGTAPLALYDVVKRVCGAFADMHVAIHCHNDSGCAVANSLLAVEAGAMQVQGTFIGFGERCGNADLSAVIANLKLKRGYEMPNIKIESLSETAIRIAEIANLNIPGDKPFIGKSAFAHKGGMHIDGVSKLSISFEHIDPALVGNRRRFLTSEVSGRTTVLEKAARLAPELKKDSPETAQIVEKLKELESNGYQFEAADASFELLILKLLGRYQPYFSLIQYKTTGDYPVSEGATSAYAMIQIRVDGKTETAASTGNGPVNALDLALRKALSVFYPQLAKVHLTDYKVRVLGDRDATAAKVRVLIESSDGEQVWTTVGVATDIIEASWIALVDSLEYKLING